MGAGVQRAMEETVESVLKKPVESNVSGSRRLYAIVRELQKLPGLKIAASVLAGIVSQKMGALNITDTKLRMLLRIARFILPGTIIGIGAGVSEAELNATEQEITGKIGALKWTIVPGLPGIHPVRMKADGTMQHLCKAVRDNQENDHRTQQQRQNKGDRNNQRGRSR